jgi:hypothetical protein
VQEGEAELIGWSAKGMVTCSGRNPSLKWSLEMKEMKSRRVVDGQFKVG